MIAPMRAALRSCLLLVMVGCAAEEDPWVVRPPGGGGGGGGGVPVDAPPVIDADPDAISSMMGRLCPVTDPRDPFICPIADTFSNTLVERLGTAASTTAAPDGTFTLDLPFGSVVRSGVGDASYATSIVTIELDQPAVRRVPIMTRTVYTGMIAAMDATVAPGNGWVLIQLLDAVGRPVAGATFDVAKALQGPFYEGNATTAWVQGGSTGVGGIAAIVDIPTGPYLVTGASGTETISRSVMIHADAVTFLRVRLAN